jgi:hypothetical protein
MVEAMGLAKYICHRAVAMFLISLLVILASCKDNNFTSINMLLYASWTNVGDRVLIIDASKGESSELADVILEEIAFYKDAFRGSEKAKKVDSFIENINAMYLSDIKAVGYKKTSRRLEIVFENDEKIIWHYDKLKD